MSAIIGLPEIEMCEENDMMLASILKNTWAVAFGSNLKYTVSPLPLIVK
jgi:hypothetical protein